MHKESGSIQKAPSYIAKTSVKKEVTKRGLRRYMSSALPTSTPAAKGQSQHINIFFLVNNTSFQVSK